MVVDRVNGEVFDGEVPLAAHEVGMRLESSPLDRFDLLGAPVEFFLSLHARQQVVHIRKGGETGTRTAEGHVHGNVEPLGQNEDAPGKHHHPTPGLACSIESLLHRIGAVHLFLGQHGSGVLQVAGLGGNSAVFRHVKNPVRQRFPRNNADTSCGRRRRAISEAIVEIHRVFTRFHVAGQRNADGEFVDGFRSKNGRYVSRPERGFGPGKKIQIETEETEPAAGCGGVRFIALHPPNLRSVEDGGIGGLLAITDAESHNSIADLGWEDEFQGCGFLLENLGGLPVDWFSVFREGNFDARFIPEPIATHDNTFSRADRIGGPDDHWLGHEREIRCAEGGGDGEECFCYHESVRNGEAGSPSLLYRLAPAGSWQKA